MGVEMNRWEMNDAFLKFTTICLCVALVTLVILFCFAKCSCPRVLRRGRKGRKSSRKAAFNSKSEAIAMEGTELEWIDERNTELVSSTIKVKSLHATNSQLNSLLHANTSK